MAAEHIRILQDLRTILHSLDTGSELFESQLEAIEVFKDKFKWQLQNTLKEEEYRGG